MARRSENRQHAHHQQSLLRRAKRLSPPPRMRRPAIEPVVDRCATIKDIIEALGIQRIELDLMLAASESG